VRAAAGVHHLAILVHDLPRAEAFYREVLGLPVIRRDGERSVWLDLGREAFLALERAPPSSSAGLEQHLAPAGWHLVALRIDPSERGPWLRRLAEANVPVFKQTAFTLYIQDPEGNRVGLSHWPEQQKQEKID
jgi:catechol-2,3-dioxygenase